MTKTIRFYTTGSSEVLRLEQQDIGEPGEGEVLVRHRAIGVNYLDIYYRTGLYPAPSLPSGLGNEASGVVEAIGAKVQDFEIGDRVAYVSQSVGAYAEARILPASTLVKLPESISFELAAAAMLQGMTTQFLLRHTYPVKPGDTILIQAAAGGVGQIACQWAKHLGATVIGTVGSKAKADIVKTLGCDFPILYNEETVSERVMEITRGKGVAAVYDSVGKDTFDDSLKCLQPRGMMVSFGQSSGAIPAFAPSRLMPGSYYLTRPVLFHYIPTRKELLATAGELFDVLQSGAVNVNIYGSYPLANAGQAHDDLESRKTTGSILLIPG